MNYYIQGSAARAEQIKAAFEKLGYRSAYVFNAEMTLYFTFNGEIKTAVANSYKSIIKTHPDYKELELPVKPKFKFKVGDWIVGNEGIFKITQYEEEYGYYLTDTTGRVVHFVSPDYVESNFHLWTIDDAKDGDMLTDGKLIVIFNKFEEPSYKQHIIAHIGLDLCGRLQITEDTWQLGVDKAMPAAKEQHDLLFQKMKEAGYEWDADKKELKKIQPHYDISNFKPFDKVLCRGHNRQAWRPSLYGFYDTTGRYPMFVCATANYLQCIPFDGNEHLLGTTDMCDEMYVNW